MNDVRPSQFQKFLLCDAHKASDARDRELKSKAHSNDGVAVLNEERQHCHHVGRVNLSSHVRLCKAYDDATVTNARAQPNDV
jgi:hypothetical protein